ncbi:MAG: DEAD/DEAH box helicase [Lacibacter sp.]
MTTFESLGLEEPLLRAVTELGFTTPTPIQQKAIPVLLSGTKDFIGLAQTGTGKTAAFGLPLLQLLSAEKRFPQALVVCPTRELCLQIVTELERFKKYKPQLQVVAVYGGASIGMQIRELKRGVQIVVATPGRLIDLIERKAINLGEIEYLVLDEADEMLNMGFEEDIEFILQNTPKKESTWLFSATMPPEIRNVSRKYMNQPVEVTVGKVNTANKNIDHQYYVVASHHRYEALKRLIDFNPGIYGIIFTRTKADAQQIAEKLTREGYDIDALHGDLSQQQRDSVMKQFREKTLQLLIATDVAARGIDVKDITHVINYELPDDTEVYTHRSGRTGRAGKTGICMSIIHSREIGKIKAIERLVQAPFHKLEVPSGKDVCRKQFFAFMDKLISTDVSNEAYETYVPMLQEKFADMSKEEILKRVAALEFDRFLKYYENAEDLNLRQSQRQAAAAGRREAGSTGARRERTTYRDTRGREFGGGSNYVKLFVNLGTKDGFYKASFLQFLLDLSDLRKDVLGRIDMRELNSWVEVDKQAAPQMIRAINGKKFKGRSIRMNEA